jgi:PAS domain S-box-containing protein
VRLGIAFRINLIVMAAVLVLGGSVGAFFVAEQDRSLREALERRIRLLGEQVGRYLGHELVEDAPGEVEGIAESVRDPEIAYVLVKSLDGTVTHGRWSAEVRSGVTEYEFPIFAVSADSSAEAPEAFGKIAAAEATRRIGSLSLGVDLSGLEGHRRRLVRRVVTATVGAALLAALLGSLLVRFMLRRTVTPLLDGIRGVAGGDLSRRVAVGRSGDELADVARSFNEMADRLTATLVTKGELEDTVARRTGELTDALRDRKRAQEAAAENEAQVRLLLESTAEAIYGIGTDGLCTFCNPACVRALGYGNPAELIGRNMHELVHHSSEDGARVDERDCRIYRTLREQRGYHSDDELLWRADGSHFPVELWSYPMFRGEVFAGAVVTFLDLTERKRLEDEVLKVRKLESLGVLAGGIAHDFNNLLTGILGNVSLAREALDDPSEVAELLREAEQATRRTRALTQQLLTFSRGGAPVKKVLAVRPIVEEASRFALSGSSVRGHHAFAPDLWTIEADAGQLGQLVHNLVINAVQAMTQGGELRIESANVTLSDGEVPPLPAGRYVRLRVVDQGPGIPQEHLPRIFDPYFTTKAAGHGLGLATVYSIAKRHGGHVTASSTPGHGTTFEVFLPAAGADVRALEGAPEGAQPPARRGLGRALVMDDEPAVLRVAVSMLTRLGFDVEATADGQAAVDRARVAREQGRPFDLVFVDLTVPGGMGGVEATEKIRAFDPGAVCVAASGYSNDPVIAKHRDYGFAAAVAKPYTLDDLSQAIATARRVPPLPAP